MPDTDALRTLDLVVEAVETGFSYDGIVSVPRTSYYKRRSGLPVASSLVVSPPSSLLSTDKLVQCLPGSS